MTNKDHLETKAVKSTAYHEQGNAPINIPIYLSTTYHRNPDGTYNNEYIYTRNGNPNRTALEKILADLESGQIAFSFASGMAAINAVFQSLKAGDHVLLPDDVYYNVYKLAEEVYARWDLSFSLVDMTKLDQVEAAIKENTRLIWIETPSNPQLKITDIQAISSICKMNNIRLAVDNTWPSPILQQPLALGADIVMHSSTKYFGGHSDVLGGCLMLKEKGSLAEKIKQIQKLSGAVPSPFDTWLITRGIQTLALRVRQQSTSAALLADFLTQHPQIEKVNYPGLKEHPQHEIAKQQMPNGFGAMLSVLIKGGREKAIAVSNNLKHFATATSLGGVESLVEHRKSVEGPQSPTPDNLLRLSIGLEHPEDLIHDWKQALE